MTELERLGRKARDTFVELAHLQPRVTVNNRVYLEQTTTVAELAVLARRVEVEHEMLHTWAGSTKRIKLHGTYLVKAGFDLRKRFTVNVHPDEILIELPHAQILSIEQKQLEVLALENGLWNRISPDDIQVQLEALPEQARQRATALPRKPSRRLPGSCSKNFAQSSRCVQSFPRRHRVVRYR